MNEIRWHVSQYLNGESIGHNVFTEYESALGFIKRHGLLNGTNMLCRPSQCECRGRKLT